MGEEVERHDHRTLIEDGGSVDFRRRPYHAYFLA
jgi:hypothetical protein